MSPGKSQVLNDCKFVAINSTHNAFRIGKTIMNNVAVCMCTHPRRGIDFCS